MNIELLKDGCLLMIIGMGFVFVFIQLMVWFVNLNAKIVAFINKFIPEINEENKYFPRTIINNDAEIALAVVCAYLYEKT